MDTETPWIDTDMSTDTPWVDIDTPELLADRIIALYEESAAPVDTPRR